MYKMLRKTAFKKTWCTSQDYKIPKFVSQLWKSLKDARLGKQAGSLIMIITFTVNGLNPRATCGSVVWSFGGGGGSPEKDCCWLTFQQPEQKSSFESRLWMLPWLSWLLSLRLSNNSPYHDYSHPDDQTTLIYHIITFSHFRMPFTVTVIEHQRGNWSTQLHTSISALAILMEKKSSPPCQT